RLPQRSSSLPWLRSPDHVSLHVPPCVSPRSHPLVHGAQPTSTWLSPLFILPIPTAAERLVEAHHGDELIPLGLSQRILGREQRLLRIEHLEVARAASGVALHGEVDRLTIRLDLPLERVTLRDQRLLRDERIGCLTECDRHRLLVLCDAFVPE